MSSVITRAYLRSRLLFILAGFIVAVSAGSGFILWQAQLSKTSVRYASLIRYVADATADVIYDTLRVDNTRVLALESSLSGAGVDQAAGTASSEGVRKELHEAIARLEKGYEALRVSAGDDTTGMGESKAISVSHGELVEGAGNDMLASLAGLKMPASVRGAWEGDGNGGLREDIKQVLTHANRLDIFSDFSQPAAQRVFAQIRTLSNDRVLPNLSRILDQMDDTALHDYGRLQYALGLVALTIMVAGALVGFRVFEPMMRKIHDAHESLREARDSVEAQKVRAEAADRAKSEFLANMSHEIRTPMNGVLGMAELLARTELDHRQSMFVDVIVKSGNALLTIINDILDFSKIDAGQLVLDNAPFQLAEAIEDVATLVSTRVAEKDLELIVRVDPTLPLSVVGDVGRFRQVATNLVGNAVKFTERGHVLIDVSGAVRDEVLEVVVRVEDTGIGIPAEKLRAVFEKFAQVDSSSTRRHEGTGLGLAIASRLVEMMGGEMGVESEFGRGSTFWFSARLPVDEGAERVRPVPVDVTGARILAIDDNPINRQILTEQLRNWGFDCAATESGLLGLAFLERAAELGATVDCIILDYQMPDLNGEEVARRIRLNPGTADVPIVLLTSVDQIETSRMAVECGISAQLNKPARSSALLETVVSVLQMSHAQRRRRSGDEPSIASVTPIRKPAAPQPEQRIPAAAAQRGPGMVDVLVAEDNEVNQLVFSQILDGLGVSYRIASNGRTAVELHRTVKPRVILMDVSMPEMSGLDATRAIREREKDSGVRTPIIGVTAHALKGDKERCLEAGMDDYLSKPVSPNKLQQKLENWMGAEAATFAQTA
jgi:signal transduction histidine kinase/DNA-binding response OmpR family regulator